MFFHLKCFPSKSNIVRKVSRYRVFSGPHFPIFGMKTEIYVPNTGKYEPEKTPYLDIFHAVQLLGNTLLIIAFTLLGIEKKKVRYNLEDDEQWKGKMKTIYLIFSSKSLATIFNKVIYHTS